MILIPHVGCEALLTSLNPFLCALHEQVFVLAPHPQLPWVFCSVSYDGVTLLWDLQRSCSKRLCLSTVAEEKLTDASFSP